jgi:hypothetical protein
MAVHLHMHSRLFGGKDDQGEHWGTGEKIIAAVKRMDEDLRSWTSLLEK